MTWRQTVRGRKITRDGFLLVLGAYGFIHEVQVARDVRPEIVLGALALMGVPLWLRADEARRRDDGTREDPQ